VESSPPDVEQTTDIWERARVMALLKGRCDTVFMGHLHKRLVREYGGVAYVMLEDYSGNGTCCRVRVTKDGVFREFEKI
jgi:predicted phosphodiesterase